MNNYEYIVASLPVIEPGSRLGSSSAANAIIDDIREQLSNKDNALVTMLLDGFDPEKLNAGFYRACLGSGSRFLREYFLFDLFLRNTKVEYLNASLGRPEGKDVLLLEELEDYEFEQKEEIVEILSGTDIIGREKGLDMAIWEHVEEVTTMDVFDMDAILGFIARLKIIDRWDKLDPETGAELFRRLIKEIRATYDNKKQI
ncbi:MAG: DUF2764 family protein [Bacteroidales bacterium]|nr:DUF2764 family protein [Bacteroidales bacterium]MCI6680031.1 DUF2764 domain-containing protein [Bacteroides sp.]MDY5890885.1 DUF2764 family protein [Candidatus Cryptobacteroides sp.]